jgi:hypothetical protein
VTSLRYSDAPQTLEAKENTVLWVCLSDLAPLWAVSLV